MTTRLVILRHGATFDPGDEVLRIGARTDLPLSATGRAQAAAAADRLAAIGFAFVRVYSSPLRRAIETAETVAARCAPGVVIEKIPMLTEIDYGPDEGAPETSVVDRIGADAIARWEAGAAIPPGWRVDPGALTAGWRDIFDNAAGTRGPMLAVTSNGVARFALDAADDASSAPARKLRTAAYGLVEIDADGATKIAEWNVGP